MNLMRVLLPLASIVVIALIWSSCSYDNVESLVGKTEECDTIDVSYAALIAPVMAANCNSCHSAASPLGGVKTSDHSGLSVVAANGKLAGTVNHLPGYPSMPQSQPQLDSCSLRRINAWINQGYPDN